MPFASFLRQGFLFPASDQPQIKQKQIKMKPCFASNGLLVFQLRGSCRVVCMNPLTLFFCCLSYVTWGEVKNLGETVESE